MKSYHNCLLVIAAISTTACSTVSPISISPNQQFALVTDSGQSSPTFKVVDARPLESKAIQEIQGGVILGDSMLIPTPIEAVEQALRADFNSDRTLSHGTTFLNAKSFQLTKFEVTFTQRDLVNETPMTGMPGTVAIDSMFRHLAQATLGGSTIRVHIVLQVEGSEVDGMGESKATSSPGSLFTRLAFTRAIHDLARGVYYAALGSGRASQ